VLVPGSRAFNSDIPSHMLMITPNAPHIIAVGIGSADIKWSA
jgi:hypothetical protein